MTDHYREAQRLVTAAVTTDNPFPHLRPAELLAAAQVHATLALAMPSVPPVRDLSEFATLTDLTDGEHARFTEAAMSARGPVPDEANARAAAIRDLGIQNESQAGELADLRSRVVLLPEDWRDQIMSLPSLVDGHLVVDELFREIESWSSLDSGKADSTATEPRGEGEEGDDRVAPGRTGREEAAGKLWDGGQPGNAGPMPADGPATPAPPSPPATLGVVHEQWCIWYGGPDPDNAAGLRQCDDENDAREWLRWCRSGLGSGIARRTVTCSPWVVVESRPASPESAEGTGDE